ncbi:hypothetical protein [Massilia timonae]|jgi:hypothetical protein|uniref:Uncharacterized protein n=1 Tax=Massilia timonae CCUG 45783 TaxID=883126 RepID=K9DWZ8_9BURK|nr:hypothetical protein [Massilia timonae]EKU81785.1 hypothetical protein HMPREF9710_02977 [Massilia timonae CCUG 45783]
MKRQLLTDARYHTIGYIDTAADGKQTARDARLHVVGYYDPQADTTCDARLRTVGRGNLLASLVASS